MDLSITMEVPDTALFRGEGARVVGEEMVKATERGVMLLAGAVIPATPINLGHLRAGWQTKVDLMGTPADGIVFGRAFNPMGYALPVETGARPHWPPIDALVEWARRKFSASEKEARAIGYLVARKIAMRGTKGVFMAERAMAATRERIIAGYKAALARAVQRLGGRG
jgi:hypothetical protein